jgi:hypothetical protein
VLLLCACSGRDGADLGAPAPGDSADNFTSPAEDPAPDTLRLLGGQTGSDSPRESAGPCGVELLEEYELAAQTALGFSGNDVVERLVPRDVQLRWQSSAPVPVQLTFTPGATASRVSRATGEPGTCVELLRIDVTVTLSSDEPGVAGTWATRLYAGAPDYLAGSGLALRDALGTTLLARSGDPEALRLTYALDESAFAAWLVANAEVVGELDED